jgi:hypothetical protein
MPVSRQITSATRSKAHSSPVHPFAVAPSSRPCSTVASWASDSRGVGPLGPLLRSACMPPVCQRRCQMLTAWAETPSWRAPRLGGRRRRTTRRRAAGGPGAVHVLVVPQGGEEWSACRRSSPARAASPIRPHVPSTRHPRPPLRGTERWPGPQSMWRTALPPMRRCRSASRAAAGSRQEHSSSTWPSSRPSATSTHSRSRSLVALACEASSSNRLRV